MQKLGAVTGRFQPVHDQHIELFKLALQSCEHLIVAVTNPDLGSLYACTASAHRHRPADNPFTYYERVRLLTSTLAASGLLVRTTLVPFDLGAPEHWPEYVPLQTRQFVRVYSAWEAAKVELLRAKGYHVEVLFGDVATRRSSTDIRACMRAGSEWQSLVPRAARPILQGLLAAGRMHALDHKEQR
ncbi:MAG TPA: adenylyltransferase/cytidyltransferase family protein [Salinisphaeraceae bacterium]|nr:adenylyltransferase/cytidyltransferase family protein [Salinisphaeraceae bacterium]